MTVPARRRRLPADLGPRVVVAVPAAAVLIALTAAGGPWFAVALGLVGAAGTLELGRLLGVTGRALAPGCVVVAAAPPLALAELAWVAAALAPVAAVAAALLAPATRRPAAAAGTTLAAIAWLGGCLAAGVALRELPDGLALVIAVLLATFVGDTAAQLVGTAFGRHRLAPAISPNKTVEGLGAGLVVGTAACAGFLALAAGPTVAEGLALGLACAIAAPVGDLGESALKRRAGVKDSGRAFGPHGGVLDRIDAVLLAALVGYAVARTFS